MPRPPARALAKFGFWSIVLYTINSVIGSGIFLTPGSVVKVAGGWTWVVYLAAGVLAGILAITFAAAAKYVTENGSSFAYTRVAFGNDLGFYAGITRFVAAAVAWGVMGTAVTTSVLQIFGGKAAVTTGHITIGFVVLMAVLFAVTVAGTGVTKWFSNISTIGKVAALALAVVAGLVLLVFLGENHLGDLNNLTGPHGGPAIPSMTTALFVGATLNAFYAYTGFESVATASSEMQEPQKNLPRAIPLGVLIVAVFYVGVLSIVMAVNPVGILHSDQTVALASAFSSPWIRNLIVLGALLSMFGINVSAAFSAPRVLDAMSEQRMVPARLSRKSSRGVPVLAFALTALVALAVPMAFGYSMRGVMVISTVTRFAEFLVVPLAVIVFWLGRARFRTEKAPRSVVTDVVFPVVGLAVSVFLMVEFDWAEEFSTSSGAVNWWAVWAMIACYAILPLVLYVPYKMGLYRRAEDAAPAEGAR